MKKILPVLFLFCALLLNACTALPDATDTPIQSDAEEDTPTTSGAEEDTPTTSDAEEDAPEEASFTAHSYTCEDGTVFAYYLYTPAGATDNMPMIVYLHGSSQQASTVDGELELLTSKPGLPLYVSNGSVVPDCYVLFPQLPKGYSGWKAAKDNVYEMIDAVAAENKADTARISLTGHSLGGGGTWNLALAAPDRFYKIAPLSGTIQTTEETLAALQNTQIWAVVSNSDKKVDPQTSITFIGELSKTNSNAKITVLDGYSHTDVVKVYLDKDLDIIGWLSE